MTRLAPASAARSIGRRTNAPLPEDPKDRRLADLAWTENASFFAMRQAYVAVSKLGDDLLAAGAGDPVADGKASLAWSFSSTRWRQRTSLLSNPAALIRAVQTGGRSVTAGARNFESDVIHKGGRPRQVDVSSVEVGRNLAATPGKSCTAMPSWNS